MEKITRQAIDELMAETAGPAVTIYTPMHQSASPPHITENQIRLKNLIRQATEQLRASGDREMIALLGSELTALLHNQKLWESQTHGLLICAGAGRLRMFRLPIDTEEYVAVDTGFHLAPVLSLLHSAQDFYLLAVAQHEPRLCRGGMYGLEVVPASLPVTLEAGLHIDENNQKSEQSLSAGGSSIHTTAFNGRGGARDPREADRLRFFRMIDKAMLRAVDRSLPLLLAGTGEEVAAYRAISKHPYILEGSVAGSTSGMSAENLFRQATAIIRKEVVAPRQHSVMQEYERLAGATTDRTATTEPAIRQAAEQGRIATLIVGMQRLTADTVRDSSSPVDCITFPRGTLRTLVHRLAQTVQQMRGTIVSIDEARMPGQTPIAAILRY